ncbi:hypothetical protein [Geminisphaera colitermitum]|uniref:hypothetical protein n=1 Tax=Geminisphaera colitermitum TaxID=1148786 RepID=UPI0012FED918|nr:hypothetical protein [Geminisphaera colitermitum]
MPERDRAYWRAEHETRDSSVPEKGTGKRERMSLGLELLLMRARKGVPLSFHDIAAWCGCTKESVRLIEAKALKRVRMRARALAGEVDQ